MSLIAIAALVALTALIIWTVGSLLGRLGGALLVITALISIVLDGPTGTRLALIALGSLAWLVGHFLAAYKQQVWRSRLAGAIVAHTPLRYVDPISGHEARDARRQDRSRTAKAAKQDPDKAPAPVDHFAEWEREMATTPAPSRRPAPKRPAARPAGPSRSAVYGKRAAKAATNLAVRKVPGARVARSAWRFIR